MRGMLLIPDVICSNVEIFPRPFQGTHSIMTIEIYMKKPKQIGLNVLECIRSALWLLILSGALLSIPDLICDFNNSLDLTSKLKFIVAIASCILISSIIVTFIFKVVIFKFMKWKN